MILTICELPLPNVIAERSWDLTQVSTYKCKRKRERGEARETERERMAIDGKCTEPEKERETTIMGH